MLHKIILLQITIRCFLLAMGMRLFLTRADNFVQKKLPKDNKGFDVYRNGKCDVVEAI